MRMLIMTHRAISHRHVLLSTHNRDNGAKNMTRSMAILKKKNPPDNLKIIKKHKIQKRIKKTDTLWLSIRTQNGYTIAPISVVVSGGRPLPWASQYPSGE